MIITREKSTEPLYNKRDYFHALYYIDFENDNYLSHNYLFNFKRRESAMGDDMGILLQPTERGNSDDIFNKLIIDLKLAIFKKFSIVSCGKL